MKLDKKKIMIIGGIALLLIVVAITIAIFAKPKKEKNINEDAPVKVTSKELKKSQTVKGLTFKDFDMVVSDGITNLNIKVENKTSKDIEVEDIIIHVKNKKGKEIVKLTGYVGGMVKAKETREIINTTDISLKEAYSVEYEF